jgi:uncharacterized protein YndB with AHSA1/START domain
MSTTQVYRVWIKATPEAVWDAITSSEWTDRYGYGGTFEDDRLAAGEPYRMLAGAGMQAAGYSGPTVDGEVLEMDAPKRLSMTWRMLMDASMQAEGFTRVTYEIQPQDGGVTRLTVTHDVTDAPGIAAMISGQDEDAGAGGGWAWILSDLKSLLETGAPMRSAPTPA